jgi:hypothetical protein
MHGGSITAATHKSVQAAAGVTRLMQQCTHMLKERMFPNEQGIQRHSPAGGTPDMTMKAVAPVLEGVLGQLTEEYERRLLTKDHELSKAQNAQRRAEDEAQRVKASDGLAQQSYVLLSTCQTLRAGASLQHSACVPPVALIHAATVISTAAEHSVLNTH